MVNVEIIVVTPKIMKGVPDLGIKLDDEVVGGDSMRGNGDSDHDGSNGSVIDAGDGSIDDSAGGGTDAAAASLPPPPRPVSGSVPPDVVLPTVDCGFVYLPHASEGGGDANLPTWSSCASAPPFLLRGRHYKTDKKKVPSEPALYDCVAVGTFSADGMRKDFLPSLDTIPGIGESVGPFPAAVVVTVGLPLYSPRFTKWDGDSFHVVTIGVMSPALRAYAEDLESAPPSVQLAARYFSNAESGA